MTAITRLDRSESEPRVEHLTPGRRLHAHLPAGTLLVAAEGSLQVALADFSGRWLEAVMPAWLDGPSGAREVRLEEGECHRLERAAWVGIRGARNGAAACAVIQPTPRPQAWATALRTVRDVWLRARRFAGA